jgi:hypothetical protein
MKFIKLEKIGSEQENIQENANDSQKRFGNHIDILIGQELDQNKFNLSKVMNFKQNFNQ